MQGCLQLDLMDKKNTEQTVSKINPDVIISCAGVLSHEGADENVYMTENLIRAAASCTNPPRIILSGSAGVYGEVGDVPVSEDTELSPISPYAMSKAQEEKTALTIGRELGVQVIIARIFNPIGLGMNKGQLVPRILRQLVEIKLGTRQVLEIRRLDAARDYINIRDVAEAFKAIVSHESLHAIYNIGSGISTSNNELIRLMISNGQISEDLPIKETQQEPEPRLASCANITRMTSDFGWKPTYTLKQTVKEIMDAQEDR